jgi:hypothetical protein
LYWLAFVRKSAPNAGQRQGFWPRFRPFPQALGNRGGQCLGHLDSASGQAEMADQRSLRPAPDKRPALPEHRRRHREEQAVGASGPTGKADTRQYLYKKQKLML